MPNPSDFPRALYVLEDYEIITEVWIMFSVDCFKFLNCSFAKVVIGHAEQLLYEHKKTYLRKRKKYNRKTPGSKVAQPCN